MRNFESAYFPRNCCFPRTRAAAHLCHTKQRANHRHHAHRSHRRRRPGGFARKTLAAFRRKHGERAKRKKVILCVASHPPGRVHTIPPPGGVTALEAHDILCTLAEPSSTSTLRLRLHLRLRLRTRTRVHALRRPRAARARGVVRRATPSGVRVLAPGFACRCLGRRRLLRPWAGGVRGRRERHDQRALLLGLSRQRDAPVRGHGAPQRTIVPRRSALCARLHDGVAPAFARSSAT